MNIGEFALLALGAGVGVVVLRFLIAAVNTEGDLQDSVGKTAMFVGLVVGSVLAALATGLASFGDIIGQIVAFVGGHPFVASNLAGIGLGGAALSGLVTLSADQYVGIALLLVGAVFVVQEVSEA